MTSARRLVSALAGGLFLAAVPIVAQAQTGTVTGRVVDSTTQQGIVAVTISVEGTHVGTQTRGDGGYTIGNVPAGSRTLRVTRIGFRPQTVPVAVTAGATVSANISLAAIATQLTQIVTVAYSSGSAQQQRNVTGSVAAVDSAMFNKGRVVTPEELIQAKVPGVQVVSSAQPGGAVTVRVRGGTSITASNDPLFVVDGIPLPVGGGLSGGRNPLNFLNPQDIASMTVLKDASATSIYGSRGANGVILITTKNGTQGGTQVSYGTTLSSSTVIKEPNVLDATQFRAAVQQYAPSNLSLLGSSNTNFFDAIKRTGYGQEHNVAIGGTRQDLRYRLSLGYLDQNAVLVGDNTNRLSGSLNYTDQLFKNILSVESSVRAVRTRDRFGGGNELGDALAFAPTQPITTGAGSYFEFANVLAPNNPLARIAAIQNNGQTDRGIGNLQVRTQLPFISGLSATVRGSFDAAKTTQTTFTPSTDRSQLNGTYPGSFYKNLPDATTLVLDAYGNYTHTLDRYSTDIDVTGGYSYETFRGNNASYLSQGLSTNLLGTGGIPAATQQSNTFDIQESRLASFFGRANFTFKDRYLLGLSVRRDGSSRFGINNQWGTFPAVSAGWRVGEEEFFKGKIPGVSDLKLRYSYGKNGNQAFGNYLAVSTYSYSTTPSQVQFGNTFVPTVAPSAANPNLKWEETASHDVGLDLALFDSRISATLDYYIKNTTNLLFSVPVAAGTNFGNRVTQNVGSVRNGGVEIGLNAQVLRGASDGFFGRLRYDASLVGSTNRNRVVAISTQGGASAIAAGQLGFIYLETIQPGFPVNTFLLYQHKTDASGNAVMGKDAAYNTTYYVDQNGDGQINQADLKPFHNPAPRWILGHTSNFGYKRVDLGFTLRSYLGYYVYNANAAASTYAVVQGGAPRNVTTDVYKYGFVTAQPFSDLYVEDASFLRMDNLTLGFTLPHAGALRNTRVFGTVQNVFTITKYSGIDPQPNAATATGNSNITGIDTNNYPLSRTFTIGLNIGF